MTPNFTFGQSQSRSLEGRCDGTRRCTSEGPHLTGCVKLRADLVRFKASRKAYEQGRR